MRYSKFILFIISFLFINSVHAQRSQSFKEFNTGIIVTEDLFDNYSNDLGLMPFPSFLWGKTYQKNKRIFEWQAGVAFPTLVTGKLTLAHGKFDKYSGISLWVFPPTIGPQFKIKSLIISAELGPELIGTYWGILTVGFRR
jgi:hypothetical protein